MAAFPRRTPTKTMRLPFGDHLGQLPEALVSWRVPLPSRPTTQRYVRLASRAALSPGYVRAKAIRVPSGDQAGIESKAGPRSGCFVGGNVSWRRLLPSGFISQISVIPDGPAPKLWRT